MSQVVQAKCPFCQNVLRIPAEWVSKAMRCKHCKNTFQAKSHTAASVNAASTAVTSAKPPVAKPAKVPVGIAAGAPPKSGTPFGFDQDEPPAPSNSGQPAVARRRRKSGLLTILVMCVVLFVVLPVAGVLVLAFTGAGSVVYKAFTGAPRDPKSQQSTKGDTPKTETPPKAKGNPDNPPPVNPLDKKKFDDAGKEKDLPPIDTPKKDDPPIKKKKEFPLPKNKDDPKPKPVFGDDVFPRRALLISVNNYFFYNTVQYGTDAETNKGKTVYPGSSTAVLRDGFQRAPFYMPPAQIVELSDGIPPGKKVQPHSTQKSVVEAAIKEFTETSRAQDRIVLLYTGHAAHVNGKSYLVPPDADIEDANTLLPLDWVYAQLTACKAQQKILILDVFRFSPSKGSELKVTGEGDDGVMPEGFDKDLMTPPAGVQVWSACQKNQNSIELEGGSAFLQALCNTMQMWTSENKGFAKAADPIPLEGLQAGVNKRLQELIGSEKERKQEARVTGTVGPTVAFDRDEKLATPVSLVAAKAAGGDAASTAEVNGILEFFKDLPPVRETRVGDRALLDARYLPVFGAATLNAYKTDGYKDLTDLRKRFTGNKEAFAKDYPLRASVLEAMEALQESNKIKMYEVQRSPVTPARKADVEKEQKVLAESTFRLEQVWNALKEAGVERDKDTSRRWQANYDYARARMQSRLVYLIEYNYVLAAVRRDEMPDLVPPQDGWRIGTGKKITVNERKAKDIAKDTRKLWDKIVKDYPNTPWALLATREKEISLGLQWRPKSN